MKSNKGQALVEFVLILPIFIFILFLIIDFGMITNGKVSLENTSSDIIEAINNNETIANLQNKYKSINISTSIEGNYKKITLLTNVKLITPGIDKIMNNPYPIIVTRYIYE